MLWDININPETMNLASFSDANSPYIHNQVTIMDAIHYWSFAREYSIWNCAFAVLQLWTADLEPHLLSDAIEWVYTDFLYSNSAQHLQNLPEEILFGCFMTTFNDTFQRELTQEDKGYESGRESLSIPTPLRRVPRIYHVSTSKNLSFDPTTTLTTAEDHPDHLAQKFRSHSPVCHHLAFTSPDKENHVRTSDPHFQHPSTPESSPLH